MTNDSKKYYTVAEFAELIGVAERTIENWIIAGKIKYWQVETSRVIRIPASELERHIRPKHLKKVVS